MAKKDLKLEVLAIGDGYNDQLMLQAADVGIRINNSQKVIEQEDTNGDGTGKKKKRTVEANADFVITNFFQIEKLILAHGFYTQMQISKLIYFYIYKNVVLVACELVFQYYAGFSREKFFIGIFISNYNLVLSTIQAFVALLLEFRNLNQPL